MNIGLQIDKLTAIRKQIADTNHTTDKILTKLKARYATLQEKVEKEMQKKGIEYVEGKEGKGELTKVRMANVKDWKKTYQYIVKNSAWDLLSKKINNAAYREKTEPTRRGGAYKKIPGIVTFNKVELKIGTKPRSKLKKTRAKLTK